MSDRKSPQRLGVRLMLDLNSKVEAHEITSALASRVDSAEKMTPTYFTFAQIRHLPRASTSCSGGIMWSHHSKGTHGTIESKHRSITTAWISVHMLQDPTRQIFMVLASSKTVTLTELFTIVPTSLLKYSTYGSVLSRNLQYARLCYVPSLLLGSSAGMLQCVDARLVALLYFSQAAYWSRRFS